MLMHNGFAYRKPSARSGHMPVRGPPEELKDPVPVTLAYPAAIVGYGDQPFAIALPGTDVNAGLPF